MPGSPAHDVSGFPLPAEELFMASTFPSHAGQGGGAHPASQGCQGSVHTGARRGESGPYLPGNGGTLARRHPPGFAHVSVSYRAKLGVGGVLH